MGASGGPKIINDSLKLLLDARDYDQEGDKSYLADLSGNSNSGSMYTGIGLAFDGTDDWVPIGDSSLWDFGTNNFSISCWVKLDTDPLNADGLVGATEGGSGTNNGWSFHLVTGISARFWDIADGSAVGNTSSPTFSADSKFHHVVAVRDGDSITVYADGVAGTPTTGLSSASIDSSSSNQGITLGSYYNPNHANSNANNNLLNGSLSDVRIYHVALSSDNVFELYNNPNKVIPNGVSASNLKGWWPLSEGSGTVAYDGSGNNNNGSFNSAPAYITSQAIIPQFAGKGLSKKMHFDGTNDYVDLGTTTDLRLANITISSWINASAIENDVDIVSSAHGDGSNGYRFGINSTSGNSEVLWLIGDASSYNISYSSGLSHTIGAWRHVVGTYDGSNLKVYVDGSLSTTTSATKTITHAYSLHIGGRGADSQPSDNTWNGLIDEVAIWNVALDANAVSAIYNSKLPLDPRKNSGNYNNQSDLVGYWRNTRAPWKDLSANSNDGTVAGDPYWIKFPEGKTAGRDSNEMNLSDQNSGIVDSADYISVADSDDFHFATGNFTIEMWAKRPTGAGSGSIYEQYVDNSNFQQIFWHSNNYLYYYNLVGGGARPYLNTSNALSLDTWYHLVFVRYGTSANNMYVYVDTVSQSITWNTGLSENADIPNIDADLWFGKADPYGYGTFGGGLGSIKVYKGKALSTAEISQNYNTHKTRFK